MNRQEIPFLGQVFKERIINNSLKTEKQRIPKIMDECFPKVEISSIFEPTLNLNEVIAYQGEKGIRDCFKLSYFYCLFDRDYKIAQGISHNFRHAWCEKGDIVYDPSIEIIMKKKQFYKEAVIDLKSVNYYSSEEATKKTIKHGVFNYTLNSDKELSNEGQSFLGNCFLSLYNNISRLEKFHWYINEMNEWKFALKFKGEETQIFDRDKTDIIVR
jgi:hypothetical protein